MSRKPLTVRSTIIMGIALALGRVAQMAAETIMVELGHNGFGVAELAGMIVTLWAIGKLHAIIEDPK